MRDLRQRLRTAIGSGVILLAGLTVWVGVPRDGGAQGISGYQTISDFEVPEFDRDNRLRSKLFGKFARIMPSGLVDIEGMRIDFYDDKRRVEMRVDAETCMYDRVSRNAKSDTAVRIARDNMIITGTGFDWNAQDGNFEIHKDAKVVLKGALRSVRAEEAE